MNTKAVVMRIDEILRVRGFSRHKSTWNRKSGPFIDVIDLQKSKFDDAITVNAGVLHPEIHRICWENELPAIIQEPLCNVRARVGALIDGKDLWWELSDAGILDDVVEKVTMYALPFVEQMHSLEAMEQFLTAQVAKDKYPPTFIYLAIIKSKRGDRAGACALLDEFGRKTIGGWRDRIAEIASQLGCS